MCVCVCVCVSHKEQKQNHNGKRKGVLPDSVMFHDGVGDEERVVWDISGSHVEQPYSTVNE